MVLRVTTCVNGNNFADVLVEYQRIAMVSIHHMIEPYMEGIIICYVTSAERDRWVKYINCFTVVCLHLLTDIGGQNLQVASLLACM